MLRRHGIRRSGARGRMAQRSLAAALLLLNAATLSATAAAQEVVVVERNVNLRHAPSTNQLPIRLLQPPEELELQDTAKVNNYYHVVRAESNDTGWV